LTQPYYIPIFLIIVALFLTYKVYNFEKSTNNKFKKITIKHIDLVEENTRHKEEIKQLTNVIIDNNKTLEYQKNVTTAIADFTNNLLKAQKAGHSISKMP
jgi:hypothetical protein